MAIANLERFVSASRNPLALGTFWQRDHQALQTLLDIFATSQYFSDLLLDQPESLDLLLERVTRDDLDAFKERSVERLTGALEDYLS